jgi:OOP family OmpA-OmpF porin
MPNSGVSSLSSLLRRALLPAIAASVIPVGTAFAQEAPYVRVTANEIPIESFRRVEGEVLMRAPRGTLLEVIHTRGDRYAHREDNWYWVQLPPDSWGTQRVGWVSGRDVERAPAPPRPKPAPAVTESTVIGPPAPPAPVMEAAQPVPAVVTNVPAEPVVSEVVVHFAFDKSDLLDEGRAKLDEAVAMLKGKSEVLSVALEGHADWTGPEGYNEKLGLARAEAVRRYLADQHQVEVTKITVVSYGESQPAVPNDTRDGRAQNRRVVIKVTN